MKEQKKTKLLTPQQVAKEAWAGVEKIKNSNRLVKGVVWALDAIAPAGGTWEEHAAFAKNALGVVKKMNALWATVKNPDDILLERMPGTPNQWDVLHNQITTLNWDPNFLRRTYGHMVYAPLNREITKYAIGALINGGAQLVGYDEHGKKLPTLTVTVAKKLLNEVHRLTHAPLAAVDGALARVVEIKNLVVEWKERYKF